MATYSQQIEFINKIGPIIKKVAKERGYHVASPIVAQACCESNFGQSKLSANYHNYFGLKCGRAWKGRSVNFKTKEEYKVGQLSTIRDNFRVYESMEEGVNGYFDFINTKRYSNLKMATTPRQYLEYIKADGYATSSTYVNTNMSYVTKFGLDKFDRDDIGLKSIDEIANEVINNQWGNGDERKTRLTQAGYNYKEVQSRVNQILKGAK